MSGPKISLDCQTAKEATTQLNCDLLCDSQIDIFRICWRGAPLRKAGPSEIGGALFAERMAPMELLVGTGYLMHPSTHGLSISFPKANGRTRSHKRGPRRPLSSWLR